MLAHELAHVRRWDYAVHFAQQLVEAVLFFNPAVRWVSRQVRAEREACCDAAAAIAMGTGGVEAAKTLALFAERLNSPAVLAVTGGPLLDRVRRLLRPGDRPALAAPWYAALSAVSVGLVLLCLARVGTDVAVAQVRQLLTPAQRVEQIAQIQRATEPPPVDDTRKMLVHGTVRTADGSPLPADLRWVNVQILQGNNSIGESPSVRKDGGFSEKEQVGRVTALAMAAGYAPVGAGPFEPAADGTLPPIDLVIDRGFTAAVHVIDPTGAPVIGAAVTSAFVQSFVVAERAGKTDAAGNYAVPNATAAIPLRVTVTIPGFEATQLSLTLRADKPAVVQLIRAEPTTGTVVDAVTGLPIAGATVKMVGRQGIVDGTRSDEAFPPAGWQKPPLLATTDAAGRFTLDTLQRAGLYEMWASAAGHGSEAFPDVRAGLHGLTWRLGPPHVIRGRITGDLSRLPTARHGAGRVIMATTDEEVALEGSYGNVGSPREVPVTITGAVGTFEIPDPFPGNITFDVPAHPPVRVDVPQGPTAVTIDLGTGPAAGAIAKRRTVQFRFDVPAGAAPPGGKLRVFHWSEAMRGYDATEVPVENGVATYAATTPIKVGYAGDKLAGYWADQALGIDVPDGADPLVVTVPVVPAGAVSGVVTEPDGSPCKSLSVSCLTVAKSPWLGDRQATLQPFDASDGSGRYLLSPVVLGGTYRLVAWAGERFAVSDAMVVDATTPLRNVPLRFVVGKPIEVRVVDGDGAPRAGAEVDLNFRLPEMSFGSSGRGSDSAGRVRFEHVNPDAGGTYTVAVKSGAGYSGATAAVTFDGRPIVVTVAKGLSVSGRVTDARTGLPLKSRTVYASPRYGEGPAERERVQTRTDTDGRFTFTNLSSGRYAMEVDDAAPPGATLTALPGGSYRFDYLSGWQPVVVEGGQKDPVDLTVRPVPR